ncbi:MAG: hypothetical protein MUC34_11855 [Anaerolineae bacterium]|nr:hypothetical protein [Anaerolineae bacterium]
MNLRKAGGIAALVLALAYIVGAALNFTVLDASAIVDPTLFRIQIFFIYVVFGVALVFLAQALDAELRPAAPSLMRVGTAFGLVWAGLLIAAGNVFIAGLNAVAGHLAQDPARGLWTLLVSLALLRSAAFPRALGYLGIVVGIAGLLTAIPAIFMPAVALYALGHCAWWTWLAVRLLRGPRVAPAAREALAPGLSAR